MNPLWIAFVWLLVCQSSGTVSEEISELSDLDGYVDQLFEYLHDERLIADYKLTVDHYSDLCLMDFKAIRDLEKILGRKIDLPSGKIVPGPSAPGTMYGLEDLRRLTAVRNYSNTYSLEVEFPRLEIRYLDRIFSRKWLSLVATNIRLRMDLRSFLDPTSGHKVAQIIRLQIGRGLKHSLNYLNSRGTDLALGTNRLVHKFLVRPRLEKCLLSVLNTILRDDIILMLAIV